jgi:hypothetical protein
LQVLKERTFGIVGRKGLLPRVREGSGVQKVVRVYNNGHTDSGGAGISKGRKCIVIPNV